MAVQRFLIEAQAFQLIDNADPAIQGVLDFLLVTTDPDGHPRAIDRTGVQPPVRDRGADEFRAFLRGDADGNGCVDGLVDSLYILNYAFSGGPPVRWALVSDSAVSVASE